MTEETLFLKNQEKSYILILSPHTEFLVTIIILSDAMILAVMNAIFAIA